MKLFTDNQNRILSKKIVLVSFITALFIVSACDKQSVQFSENKNQSHIIQDNISILENILDADSLRDAAYKQDDSLQNVLSDSLLAEYRGVLAILFYKKSDFYLAEDYFHKSEESFRKANLLLKANQMLANRAVVKDLQGNYPEAVSIYLSVVEFFKEQKDSTSWASALGNIGTVYEEMGMADKAIYYDKLSLSLTLRIGDTLRAAGKYNNIGVAFEELVHNADSAIYYYTKAYDIYEKNSHRLSFAQVCNNLGLQYVLLNDFKLAEYYLKKAQQIFDSLHNKQGKADIYHHYGKFYFAKGNNAQAAKSLNAAINIMKETGDKKNLIEVGSILSEVYIKMGKYTNALKMMQFSNNLKDSVLNVENTKIIADMEAKYQLNEKNNTIEILKLKEDISKKQVKIQWVFIGLLIVAFVLIVLVFYFNVQKNKFKEEHLRQELQNYMLQLDKLQQEISESQNNKFHGDRLSRFQLSEREKEVLNFIAQGYKNAEIAEKLFVSKNTIKTHIKNIYIKLDVRNRVEALKKVDFIP